ncbi:hypothetical protein Pla110_21020 [Polystyrenella longa]|uniref:Uncharacterized protein n=1 Tax=Polystyrenella longa TaxID=2528007 RepID=A0A518CME7_9PLAN|nr:hypothetical protein [Polystyrenella longa]QDU80373.1 hypothetical protein Pla110_21020 [Polystyrenella longa]
MARKLTQFMTSSVDGVVQRLAFMLAFIASGVLCYLVYMTAKASVPTPVNGAAGGWLILCFSPFWLGICLLAVLSGYKLGGTWRVVGWLPLLSGLLGSLLINQMFS